MAQPTQAKPKTRQEKEALLKAARRAEQANLLAGTRPLLEKDEQLLAFARARIAGGWKSKLNVGPEAFFAPFVNVALTERRFLVQHVHHTTGRPSEMLPHAYGFDKIARVTFTDIETYGGEPACRLILHLENGLYVRLRLRGQLNFAGAKNMAELFDSLTTARRKTPISPTHSLCPTCDHVLEQPYKFCPFCGTLQPSRASNVQADAETPTLDHTGITIATPDESPLAEGAANVAPTASRSGELAEGGVDQSPAPEMTIARETDFAYERDDQPAEFGFALPAPAVNREEGNEVAEKASMQAGSDADTETGITVDKDGVIRAVSEDATARGAADALDTAQDEANFNALADDSLFTPTDEAEQATEQNIATLPGVPEAFLDAASFETAAYDDMFAPDEPVQTQEMIEPGGVAFEQYDMQAFGDLPFSDTPDPAFPTPSSVGVAVQDDGTDIARDDTTEPFVPQPQSSRMDIFPIEPMQPIRSQDDAFATAGAVPTGDEGTPTGDDNVDFDTSKENVADAASDTSAPDSAATDNAFVPGDGTAAHVSDLDAPAMPASEAKPEDQSEHTIEPDTAKSADNREETA